VLRDKPTSHRLCYTAVVLQCAIVILVNNNGLTLTTISVVLSTLTLVCSLLTKVVLLYIHEKMPFINAVYISLWANKISVMMEDWITATALHMSCHFNWNIPFHVALSKMLSCTLLQTESVRGC
jgi:hypothetical protein